MHGRRLGPYAPPVPAVGAPERYSARVQPLGKHLAAGGAPFRVHGITYGTFGCRDDGEPFPERSRLDADLAAIAAAGLNTVRTYHVPPPEMLDRADELDLRLLIGLHYDDWRMTDGPSRSARRRVRDAGARAVELAMSRCSNHPCVLAVSVGNEVPSDVVRVHGIGAVEETLSALVAEVHAADPFMLATYNNFPTTEYLDIEGQDLVCFNVFLEDEHALRAYVRRLQVLSGELPLVITELGLASEVHGERAQADALAWQLRAVDEAGCAGAVVFAWTDDWVVNGEPVPGWGFGITDDRRQPKPALAAVSSWAGSSLTALRSTWPKVSVVVCAYNEEAVIGDCLRSLAASDYPELEVIVCDDGSSDRTLDIARTFPFRVLARAHQGLSAARNAGTTASNGEIVAFLDADAFCHPEWPYWLVLTLESDDVAGAGGPNLPVPGAKLVERAVAASPGSPTHVLLGDDRAEHVPGCNMAFRKSALEQLGGFEPRFTRAGDDVDVCWRLLDRGWKIGFSPAAQVWHHRRGSIRGYLRQQAGYGTAERMVSGRHRHRYGALGRPHWAGSIYGGRVTLLRSLLRPVIYHGPSGMAPYQGIARPAGGRVADAYSAVIPLALAAGIAGVAAAPWLREWMLVAGTAVTLILVYAMAVAVGLRVPRREPEPMRLRLLAAALHVLQPISRTYGRVRGRPLEPAVVEAPWTGDRARWISALRDHLAKRHYRVGGGGPHDAWDLSVTIGPLLACRVTTAVAWNWFAQHRVALRPQRALWLSLLVVLVLLAASPAAAIVAAAIVALCTFAEGALLWWATRAALAATRRP